MKKIFVVLLIFLTLLNTYAFADGININGEGAILIDGDSGRILYEKNTQEKLYPASTTKIMTAILAIEYGKMDEIVTVDEEIIHLTKGSHIALDYDEEVRFEDLLNGLVIASANDAAMALGKHISGSLDSFVDLMNAKAKEIGAINTHFANPHGLHDDNHYTTAYDLYVITRYAMKNEMFRELVQKTSYRIPPTNKKTEERLMHTTNKFLYGNEKMYLNGELVPIKYDGITGVKTGTTPEAKNCLVSYAERNGRKLYSVVLKSEGKEVYADTVKLMDYGFNNFITTAIGYQNEFVDNINIKNGKLPHVAAILDNNVYYTLSKEEGTGVERKVKVNENTLAPISKGDVLGTVEYYLDNELIAEGNMVSTVAVDFVPAAKLKALISKRWYLFLLGLWFVYRLYIVSMKAKKRKRRSRSFYSYDSIK